MVDNYYNVAAANPDKYYNTVGNIGNGDVRLVYNSVTCTSCHGVHFTDSDSTTKDGIAQSHGSNVGYTTGLNPGDGFMLRTDGPKSANKSALCQACHKYQSHGSIDETVGCLVCHSGHSYNDGSPNYFVLRNSATTLMFGAVSGLGYTALPGNWSDGYNSASNGYCERCHGELESMSAGRVHTEAGDAGNCTTCHIHGGATATYSFEGGGCDSCHGMPPRENIAGGNPNAGFAWVSGGNRYNSATPPFKDESKTPHAAHAAGGGNYTFACNACHLNYDHNQGNFQDVFTGAPHSLASGDGNLSPSYNGSGAGTCSNVYCHSNGGARMGDVSRNYVAASIPQWDLGSSNFPISTCNACHDNSASMTNGSTSHVVHLALTGVTCKTCHVNTADNATTLAAGAIGGTGTHVNKTVDVVFDTSGFITVGATPYTGTTGTCSVYCHSDGMTMASPDWDDATSGDCGTCHDVTGASLGGAHEKHVYNATVGLNLACTICHTNNGSGADHVNGAISLYAAYQTICNDCHGAVASQTVGDDREPVWYNSATVDCATCHVGDLAVINAATAPAKNLAAMAGHNRPAASGSYGVSGNNAADKVCLDCHSTAPDANHLGGATTTRQNATTCNDCHGSGGSASKKDIVTHQSKACADCHDPHGSSNIYMVKANGVGYNGVVFYNTTGADSYDEDDSGDRVPGTTAGTEVNADDLCATCHSDPPTSHNNSVNSSTDHNQGTDCFTCHRTHSDPDGAFIVGVGTACNDCHGFPPASNAHRKGTTLSDPELHSITVSYNALIEDRSDCEACHTGASSYTYDVAYDRSPAGGSLNHSNSAGRKTILEASVGYNATNKDCTSACHNSSVADGAWNDANGLGCDACHYYEAMPVSANNTGAGAIGGSHNVHFNSVGVTIVCADCHDIPVDTAHITESGATDALKISGNAEALQDEATLNSVALNTGIDNDPGTVTCDNIACHNPSNDGSMSNDWGVSNTGCTMCHGDATLKPTTGSHVEHLNSATLFGIDTIGCNSCHVDNGTDTAHLDSAVGFVAAMNYNTTSDTCNTTTCHNDGTGSAVMTPVWGVSSANCTICHADTPTSGAHTTHISAVKGPGTGTLCNACHKANGNNSSMAGQTSHIDGAVHFTDGNALGTSTSCDTCHGGATPAATAKSNWAASTPVACESCHGDYADAVIGGKTAPHQAGTAAGEYDASGHGKSGVARTCSSCHNENAAGHLDGTSGDDSRLAVVAGYNAVTDPVGFCSSACHATTMSLHYTNGASGTSFPADGAMDCQTCHNPHGQNVDADSVALDAMIRPVIDGKNIVAMYNTAVRDNYYIDPPNSGADSGQYGVCQACHDPADPSAADSAISYFNRTTATPGHYSGTCTGCHKHDDATVAFKPSGCNGCHGDSGAGNFWPDQAAYPDRAGLHTVHVDAIGDEINGGGLGSATLDDRNASCDYCHPDPGGNNVNGNGHDTDTLTSPANVADLHKDGYNPATSFKTIQGLADTKGTYNPTIKRCSTANCHSAGEFTWTWYPDALAPGQINDLAAVQGSEPATIELTWTAPSNDGAEGPNSYEYLVRYRTDTPITTGALYNSATLAGGPPTVIRRGNQQTMTVKGLIPGTTYHLAVRTADEAYNWSLPSNSTSATSRPDDKAPDFLGITTALSADEDHVVDLTWEPALDDTPPVLYQVWYNTASIDYGAPPQAATEGTNLRVTGLPAGILYNFSVRAKDSSPLQNVDTNTRVQQTLAKSRPKVASTSVDYYTNGTTLLQTGTYGTANSSALAASASRTWAAPAYAVATNVIGTNFFCRLTNGNENLAGAATARLGYMTGAVWNDFSPPITSVKAVPPNSNKIVRFGFGSGGMVPAGSNLAVRVTNTGTLSYTLATGSATNRGDINAAEQVFNHLPPAVTFSPNPSGSELVTISWNPVTDQDAGHTVHYDVYGSDNDGASYDYIIAQKLSEGTGSVIWDTVADGIVTATARVKVLSGDGFQSGDGSGADHTESISPSWPIDNTSDTTPPAAVTDLLAETRPKMGSIYVEWTAPGDDGNGKAPASQYDIRYSTSPISSGSLFNSASTVESEPVPAFGGTKQGYEVLGLTPSTHYYFAIKTVDEANNWSSVSNQAEANGGLRCGICHGTPPDDTASEGNHIGHGYTVPDCAKCHGDQVLSFDVKHQDGKLLLGFGRDTSGTMLTPVEPTITGANSEVVTYWQDPDGAGPKSAVKIYEDTNGAGGFNETAWAGSDKLDSGSCFNFTSVNATGCHGPATPSWDASVQLPCSACHGDIDRTTDPYGRPFDDTTDDVKASPPVDNHGYNGLSTDPVRERRYVGQHEKHLNSSFRFSKGDSCRICHKDNRHADSVIDIQYDFGGAGESAQWTPYNTTTDTPGTCAGTSDITCHGANVTPSWDSAQSVDCNTCHGFGAATPDHVTDPFKNINQVDNDPDTGDAMPGNCTWCHPAGHPRGSQPGMVLIPNNPAVGLYYASGGIHLYNAIGGRTAVASEAEICWGCHDDNGISEWGVNTDANTGNSTYDYGQIYTDNTYGTPTSNWSTGWWKSAVANFDYKKNAIQSTHTTSPDGSSAVTLNTTPTPDRYEETADPVSEIRCSNCHDVHNRNLADNDTTSGTPYLRGTWKGNPYLEDGAPHSTMTYTAYTTNITHTYAASTIGFGQVPRGGVRYQQQGGYYIDENSNYPTKGWTVENSAGLCVLCHGSEVDVLDQKTDENLWLGTNGHSNSALGGTGVYGVNIFDYTHGRPVPSTNATLTSESFSNRVPDMGNQRACEVAGDQYYVYGYRLPTWNPRVNAMNNEPIDCLAYDWGATVDASSVDKGYHQFSCSKCHNPHASRLPKLMITNCLDVRHNTWDDNKNSQTRSTASTTDNGKKTAYFNSAQNCHRRDSSRSATFNNALNGGWNLATPW